MTIVTQNRRKARAKPSSPKASLPKLALPQPRRESLPPLIRLLRDEEHSPAMRGACDAAYDAGEQLIFFEIPLLGERSAYRCLRGDSLPMEEMREFALSRIAPMKEYE